jgi:hypothetical protein
VSPGVIIDISHALHTFGKGITKQLDDSEDFPTHNSSASALHITNHWRKETAENPISGILATCKEKPNADSAILIDWNEVLTTAVVTPSILSITFIVHRYFPNVDTFRGVEVEMFISNCNAPEFKELVDERLWFNKVRGSIKKLVKSGKSFLSMVPNISDSVFFSFPFVSWDFSPFLGILLLISLLSRQYLW